MTDPLNSRRDKWLVLPLVIFFTVFVAIPLLLMLGVSVFNDTAMTQLGLGQYFKFLGDSFNVGILSETLLIALSSVLVSILIGYPVAYVYTLLSRRWQRLLLFAILLPLLTSSVVRTFSWVVILGREGLINQLFIAMGLISAPIKLLYTPAAVIVAVSQIEMPMMILPLISSLTAIDTRLRDASYALGAGYWRTFFCVTLPLSVPGLLAGSLLVFAASASAFVTQTLIGGGRMIFMPFYIYQQAIQSQNYPFAATIAVVLLVTVMAIVTVMSFVGRRSKGFIYG
jgi:putative spermidine/putrescine transport system permease protein